MAFAYAVYLLSRFMNLDLRERRAFWAISIASVIAFEGRWAFQVSLIAFDMFWVNTSDLAAWIILPKVLLVLYLRLFDYLVGILDHWEEELVWTRQQGEESCKYRHPGNRTKGCVSSTIPSPDGHSVEAVRLFVTDMKTSLILIRYSSLSSASWIKAWNWYLDYLGQPYMAFKDSNGLKGLNMDGDTSQSLGHGNLNFAKDQSWSSRTDSSFEDATITNLRTCHRLR